MTERRWPTPPADLFDLTGKTALVSGGCGLLGKTFCRALATYGASVAILDLARAEPVRAASELSEVSGVNTFGVACDVSLPEDVVSAVRQVEEELGAVDVLVNNAAAKPADMGEWVRPAEDFSLSVWREIMSVNMDGLFALSRTVGNSMIKGERSGSIIHISSVYGTIAPNPDIYKDSSYGLGGSINTPPVYSASKAGVVGLSRYLAAYWGHHGVRVNTISPGGVADGQNATFQKRYGERVPLGRMAEVEELCGALIFLASEASSYVTGQNLLVDGGLSIW